MFAMSVGIFNVDIYSTDVTVAVTIIVNGVVVSGIHTDCNGFTGKQAAW